MPRHGPGKLGPALVMRRFGQAVRGAGCLAPGLWPLWLRRILPCCDSWSSCHCQATDGLRIRQACVPAGKILRRETRGRASVRPIKWCQGKSFGPDFQFVDSPCPMSLPHGSRRRRGRMPAWPPSKPGGRRQAGMSQSDGEERSRGELEAKSTKTPARDGVGVSSKGGRRPTFPQCLQYHRRGRA